MLRLFLTILLAALAFWLTLAVGLPYIVGVIVAVLVVLGGWTGPRYWR